jgi:hypothetical protein
MGLIMKKLLIMTLALSSFISGNPVSALTRTYCQHQDKSICVDKVIETDEGAFYLNDDYTISSLHLYHNCQRIGGYYDKIWIDGTPICRAKSDNGKEIIIFKGFE